MTLLIGDLLMLLAVLIFIFISVYSVYRLKKYSADKTTKLTQNELNDVKKVYFPSFFLFLFALAGVAAAKIEAPFAVSSCIGIPKCIESHNIVKLTAQIVLLLTSIIINRVSKRILDLDKSRQAN